MKYVCSKCGKEYATDTDLWRCECGGAFWLKREEKVSFTKEDIKTDEFSMWRYEKAYPMKKKDLVATFGEGLTPLVPEEWDGVPVWLKNEALMPTGSFKDRGVVMLINSLAARGVDKITEDSSGNAGASVSSYAAKAGIECNVFVPASTSEGKVTQVIAAGARIHKIPGLRLKAAEAAQSGAEGVYASHNWNPYFVEGVKSMAYEIWEQSGFTAPDNIVCPAGNGSIPLGLEQGFRELLENGQVDRLPKIFGVQPENCNPIYRKFYGKDDNFEATATIAEGIALSFSSHRDEVVKAVRKHQREDGFRQRGRNPESTAAYHEEGILHRTYFLCCLCRRIPADPGRGSTPGRKNGDRDFRQRSESQRKDPALSAAVISA